MDVQAIRSLIKETKKTESLNRHLHWQICDQMKSLHHTIELPEENACDTVITFVVDYIDHVPDFIDALYQSSNEAGVQNFIVPFLNIIEENFLSLITQREPLTGLDVLLDKAYFAYRLIEEVNDQYFLKTGTVLIPIDITWSNLIIHSILGEPFANDLNQIIEKTVKHMMSSRYIHNKKLFETFTNRQNTEKWIEFWTHWDGLSPKKDIELRFIS